ncbi:unnamed protein product [Hanseniaspora opuntiae]
MMKLPDFNHKLDREISYKIRIDSARYLLCFVFIAIIFYVYLPKQSISYSLHTPSRTNTGSAHESKRKIINLNSIFMICIVLTGVCYNSIFSYINTLDLVLITKRLGRNCMSLYVPLLFLTMRPSPLPNVLYLNLIPIHKWLGRLLVLQALIHTVLYTCLYYKTQVLWKLTKLANVYGIVSMLGFIIIAWLSISKIRRSDYRVFYISHYLLTWMTVIMLQYHARPRATYYTVANLSILAFQILYRTYLTREIVFDDIEDVSSTFKKVRIPMNLLAKRPISPGCHIRINNKHDNFFKNIFFNFFVPLQHPYTIESLPTDEHCTLIIKTGRFPLVQGGSYYVTGCFEPRLPFFNNSLFKESKYKYSTPFKKLFGNKDKTVIIVTGGSAITFGLPILQILNNENYKCKMYWITRDLHDLNLIKKNYQNLEIFITKTTSEDENIIVDRNSIIGGINLESGYDKTETNPLIQSTVKLDSPELPIQRMLSNPQSMTLNEYSGSADMPHILKGNDESDELLKSSIVYRNYGDSTDEIDFTKASKEDLKRKKSQMFTGENFRQPSALVNLDKDGVLFDTYECNSKSYGSVINSKKPRANKTSLDKIFIPKGLKINIGRPTLGFKELLWIYNEDKECNGNNVNDSTCLENIYLKTLGVGPEGSYLLPNSTNTDDKDVLVLAAGPIGLVENTKNWAILHNFQFYEEAFFV